MSKFLVIIGRILLAAFLVTFVISFKPIVQTNAYSNSVVAIDWSIFTGGNPTDDLSLRMKSLLLKTNKFALGGWWNDTEDFDSQSGSTYLDFGGNSEAHMRPSASQALALAVSIKTGIYDPGVTGFSLTDAKNKTVKLIKSLAYRHKVNSPGGWGNGWQGMFWASMGAFAGWLMWTDLTTADKEYVRKMIENECDYLLTYPVKYYKDRTGAIISSGDTGMEENAWCAQALAVGICMMPDHQNMALWMNKLLQFEIAANARPADLSSSTVYHGKAFSQWLGGSNINNDGTLINHNRLHPAYMAANVMNLFSGLAFSLADLATPRAGFINNEYLYSALTDLEFTTGQVIPGTTINGGKAYAPGGTCYIYGDTDFETNLYFPQGNDWGNTLYCFLTMDIQAKAFGFDSLSTVKGDYWEGLHGQGLVDMQNRFSDGRSFAPGESNYAGVEADVAQIYANGYLTKWIMNQPGQFGLTNKKYYTSLLQGRYNENDPDVYYTSGWSSENYASSYNGDHMYSKTTGKYFEFTYTGARAKVYSFKSYDGGHARVYVDGVYKRDIDYYNPTLQYQQLMYDTDMDSIPPGTHVISIEVKGTKTSGSTNYYVYNDRIDVEAVPLTSGSYDDTDCLNISYGKDTPPWTYYKDSKYYKGGVTYNYETGASYQFTYNGNRALIYSFKARDAGIIKVYVDGVYKRDIDLYSATNMYNALVYNTDMDSISPGIHTVRLEVKGTHNPSSSGNCLYSDKIVIE